MCRDRCEKRIGAEYVQVVILDALQFLITGGPLAEELGELAVDFRQRRGGLGAGRAV